MTTNDKELLVQLSAPLLKEDIEIRIGSCTEKGFNLLLYKTARTDVRRLNKVCGLNWSNDHFYDVKGLLCCSISLFNQETNTWIKRVDVGVESKTEREKGSYSDSFKRAGFRWGIGLELYQAPFIWINWQMQQKKPKNFSNSLLSVSKYKVVGSKIEIEIKYKQNIIFSNISTEMKDNTVASNRSALLENIRTLIRETGTDILKILNVYQIKTISDMDDSSLAALHMQLQVKLKKISQDIAIKNLQKG